MPDAGVLATILLIVGLFLLALELMIPSFGIIGIVSAIVLLISAWSAWQAWWGTNPGFFWMYAVFLIIGIPSVLAGGVFLIQNTRFGDRLVLRGPATENDVTKGTDETSNDLQSLVGQIGTTSSLLTPGGMVMVAGERFHAVSAGLVIDPGVSVKVVGVNGARLTVRAADDSPDENTEQKQPPESISAQTIVASDLASAATNDVTAADEDAGVLDFDIPEG